MPTVEDVGPVGLVWILFSSSSFPFLMCIIMVLVVAPFFQQRRAVGGTHNLQKNIVS